MLEHFKCCVFEKKEASVVYLGGSITEGQGVADKRLCWQGLLQTFLDREWKECRFSAVNAGIGGTDSGFGAFRMERDVLPHRPDLLFVEFAVNDYTRDPGDIRDSLEGILYKLWKECPQADVLFVLTTTMKMAEENYREGRLPESVRVHMETAERFGIPCVNVGTALLAALEDRGTQPRVLLPDLVHPSREGYQVYYERLKGFLKEAMTSGPSCRHRKSVAENPYTSCRMVPAANADLHGFVHENIAMCGRFGSYVSSCTPGSWLEFAFEGDKIGIFYVIACDSGDMEWSLDGGEWQYLPSWDAYALKFDRGSARMLAQALERKGHILKIRVKDSRAETSMGNFIRIGDFLVG